MYQILNIWLSVYRIWDWVLKLSNISKISVIQLCRIVDSYIAAAKSSICRRRPNPVNCCVELTPDSQRWMVGDLDSMNNANKISTFVVSRPTVTHTLLPGAHTRFGLRKKCILTQFVVCITWNINRLQVTALWLLHLLSGFLVSNVEKLRRYFLVYCPEWRVESSEHKPRPGECQGPRATHRPVADSAPGGGHLETVLASPPPPTGTGGIRSNRASNKGSRRFHRESSWLKVPNSVFTLKTLGAV